VLKVWHERAKAVSMPVVVEENRTVVATFELKR